MTLQDIFDQLSHGELSQLSIGGEAAGEITLTNYAKVLSHISLGLTALYTRFNLKEGRATLRLKPGKLVYKLDSNEDVYFLVNSDGEEFADDILKITQVITQDDMELELNDRSNIYSCHTPSARVLRLPMDLTGFSETVPEAIRTDTLTVVYRANHPLIRVGSGVFTPSKVSMELPDSHLEALLMYVASRVNNPIGMSNEFHAGNSYYAKFETACQLLEQQNLQVDQGEQNTRLQRGGWP